jgi:hypothetical protein
MRRQSGASGEDAVYLTGVAVPWANSPIPPALYAGTSQFRRPGQVSRPEDPDARAAMLGQAEAVITSRSGLGTPRWRSASAWAWATVAATPEEPPVSRLPDAFRAAVVYELAG